MDNQERSSATLVLVTAAIITHQGRILIAQRHARDRLGGQWEFPGGKVEAGESPEQCLKRELSEEFDMDADIGPALGVSIHHYDHISIKLMAYRAYWDGKPFQLHAHQACCWVGADRLATYSFAPADLPFVRRLVRGDISLE